jgi:hypothetical protein
MVLCVIAGQKNLPANFANSVLVSLMFDMQVFNGKAQSRQGATNRLEKPNPSHRKTP